MRMLIVSFYYTNHRGERRLRKVLPLRIRKGDSPYHPGNNVYLVAIDCEKKESREFLMKNVEQWSEAEDEYTI